MAQDWQIEGPRVLDIGGEGEAVRRLKVGLVAGRVDILTHDDSPPRGWRCTRSPASRCW